MRTSGRTAGFRSTSGRSTAPATWRTTRSCATSSSTAAAWYRWCATCSAQARRAG